MIHGDDSQVVGTWWERLRWGSLGAAAELHTTGPDPTHQQQEHREENQPKRSQK